MTRPQVRVLPGVLANDLVDASRASSLTSSRLCACHTRRVAVQLRPMAPQRAEGFMDRARSRFVADQITAGERPAEAERTAAMIEQRSFPDGPIAAGHLLFDIMIDEVVGGHVWLAPPEGDDATAWLLWDIEVESAQRGRGAGRATMQALEDEVRRRGGCEIVLSVFGWNTVARHLYEALGYDVVSLRMRKLL
jgi:ribosomal protein S18 acetylase RimI-like enzyme